MGYQLAECWFDPKTCKPIVPAEYASILKGYTVDIVIPEWETHFDSRGQGREHDLLILATNDKNEKLIIGVEAKVNEPFDKLLLYTLAESVIIKINPPSSRKLDRLVDLSETILNINFKKNALYEVRYGIKAEELWYQLLTGLAGVLAERKSPCPYFEISSTDTVKVMFLVHQMIPVKPDINMICAIASHKIDLDNFTELTIS